MSGQEDIEDEAIRAHLEEIDDGCGCTEVWEYLSERRDREAADE